jgi:hypothetical protein
MGADAVVAYLGVQYRIPANRGQEIEGLERKKDPRLVAARKAGLQSWWGRMTPGQPYQLLIGRELGILGAENEGTIRVDLEDFFVIIEETKTKLLSAGFTDVPALHLVLEADY